jgi:hypothetical protein
VTVPPVAVATMTLARTESEEVLLYNSLAQLSTHGWPVIVTDGGSSAMFVGRLRDLRGMLVHQASGLVPQVNASITAALASGAPVVLYTEPDKLAFFAEHLQQYIVAVSRLGGGYALALAARSLASFQTYPRHQQTTESAINSRCGEVMGVAGDFSYGPFLMTRGLAVNLATMPVHLGWGWRHFTFAIAHRLGYEIALIEGDYPCPLDQRDEDDGERAHRDRQLRENLEGLSLGLAVPLFPR